jgi:plasmid stabilization system protein ParE
VAKLVWTDEALRWLEDIFEYIAQDNPDAAARTVQGIYDRAQALVHHPEMGERYAGSERHVRILLYDHYRAGLFLPTPPHRSRRVEPVAKCDRFSEAS